MNWIKRSPFSSHEAATRRMVEFVAAEGERAGTPLTAVECEILAGNGEISEDLSARILPLIGSIFNRERQEDSNPVSFGNAMMWASDGASSNIVELTYRVLDGSQPRPRLRGLARAKDIVALVISGMVVVFLMCVAVIAAGYVFHWK